MISIYTRQKKQAILGEPHFVKENTLEVRIRERSRVLP